MKILVSQPDKKNNIRAYLDTNILLYLKKIPSSDIFDLFCSQLSIVELISGMTTEKEYRTRKHALERLMDRKINIIWQSPKTLLYKAFGMPDIDYDVLATMIMMQKIIETEEFCETESIRFYLGGNEYTIKTFIEHDEDISKKSSSLLKELVKLPENIRKEAREIEIEPCLIEYFSDMTASNLLVDLGYKENGFQHQIYFDNYKSYKLIKNGISFLMIHNILSIVNHNIPGRNDGNDLAHLIYTDDMDLFISNDKIFHKFNFHSNLQILSLTEFVEVIEKQENIFPAIKDHE
ncbi:hypothetical protein [Delftia acidovorans]